MSRPIYEPSLPRADAENSYGNRQLFRRPAPGRVIATLHIKVFADAGRTGSLITSGDGKFIFAIAQDMDGLELTVVEMFVTTVSSSGIVQVQIRNRTQAVDMLSTRVQVDAGDLNSGTSGTPPVIDAADDQVFWMDEICIDVDAAGTGAEGMGVILEFS